MNLLGAEPMQAKKRPSLNVLQCIIHKIVPDERVSDLWSHNDVLQSLQA